MKLFKITCLLWLLTALSCSGSSSNDVEAPSNAVSGDLSAYAGYWTYTDCDQSSPPWSDWIADPDVAGFYAAPTTFMTANGNPVSVDHLILQSEL